jgi:hypothetical protein
MKSYYDRLAEAINPDLIPLMTGDQAVEAKSAINAKERMKSLDFSRKRERSYKMVRPNERNNMQKNSLLLNKQANTKPKEKSLADQTIETMLSDGDIYKVK